MVTADKVHLLPRESHFIESWMRIDNKSRKNIPFRLNEIQQDFDLNETGRDIIVKPAQVGFSSYVIAKILIRTMMIPGTVSIIVAYNDFITQRLLNKAQSFYNSIPAEFKPVMTHESEYRKSFKKINSIIYIGSANSVTFARGEAIHNFLADEYAFWPNPEKIMAPAMDRIVKPSDGGRLWILSTPNGADNDFHALYQNAKDPNSPMAPHFYPWFNHPEYQLAYGHPDALPNDRGTLVSLDSDEQALIRNHEVTEEQLRWRRLRIAEKSILKQGGSTRTLFGQEYPSDDVSCFLTAGDMVYDAELVNYKAKLCRPAFQILEGGIHIWEAPKQDYRYHIAVDPGLGKTTRSAITVWRFWDEDDQEYGKLVARYAAVEGITPAAKIAYRLCTMYNRPSVAPEVNGHGLAFIHEFVYPNIYRRETIDRGRKTRQLGWLTTTRTKPAMVKELMKMLPRLEIYDIELIGELRNLRESTEKSGVYLSVGADDLHDSAAIAVITRPTYHPNKGTDTYGY